MRNPLVIVGQSGGSVGGFLRLLSTGVVPAFDWCNSASCCQRAFTISCWTLGGILAAVLQARTGSICTGEERRVGLLRDMKHLERDF